MKYREFKKWVNNELVGTKYIETIQGITCFCIMNMIETYPFFLRGREWKKEQDIVGTCVLPLKIKIAKDKIEEYNNSKKG